MTNITKEATWSGWETVRKIGTGGFGAEYEICRDVLGAVKLISLSQNDG